MQDTFIYTDTATVNKSMTNNGTSTLASATVTASLLASDKKLGAAAAGDLLDFSAATAKIGMGPTSTKIAFQCAATTNNLQDSAANEIPACARSTFSSITATNHNYAGTTPNTCLHNQQTGTATATAIGTIGATQYTPTGGVSATYAVLTYNA